MLEQARIQSENEVASLREELDGVRRELSRAHQPLQALAPLMDQVEALEEQVERPVVRKTVTAGKTAERGPLRLGEKVHLKSLKMEGVVSSLGESEVEVQVGALRVRARLGDIRRAGEDEVGTALQPAPARQAAPSASSQPSQATAGGIFHPSPGMEIDLRGQRAEDALEMLDRYLEAAYLAGLPFVRIIHGKGTGRLRQVVREQLQNAPHVKNWESGQEKEGGDGVTVARLETD